MKRKNIAMILTFSLAFSALTGCGKSVENSQAESQMEENTSDESTENVNGEKSNEGENSGNSEFIGAIMAENKPSDSGSESKLRVKLEENGYYADVEYAGNDASTQTLLLKNMITLEPKVLFTESIDSESLVNYLEEASDSGSIIISYKELQKDTDAVDYYIGFDEKEAGRLMGECVLSAIDNASEGKTLDVISLRNDYRQQEKWNGLEEDVKDSLDEGKLTLYGEGSTLADYTVNLTDVDAVNAYMMEKINGVYASQMPSAIVCFDEVTAEGTIRAFEESFEDENKWPMIISCGDSDYVTEKNKENSHILTVKEDEEKLAEEAVNMVNTIIKGNEPETKTTVNNGAKDIPAFILTPEIG